MEVNKSSIWFPFPEHMRNAIIVERLSQAHPLLKIVAGTDVVAGKKVDPTHSSEQGVFSGPAPHVAQLHQPGYRLVILQIRQRFQI
jgi:hypothetical protein